MTDQTDTNADVSNGESAHAADIESTSRALAAETLGRMELSGGQAGDPRLGPLVDAYVRVLEYHRTQFAGGTLVDDTAALIAALGRGQFAHGSRPGVNLWEDVTLAVLIGQGDEPAVEVFRSRFGQSVAAWRRRYCPREQYEVEDLVADLLLPRERSGPRIDSYRGQGPLAGWLKQVFISLCHKRREKGLARTGGAAAAGRDEPDSDPLASLPAQDDIPDERYARYECADKLMPLIRECMETLDGQHRRVLMMAVVDGAPQKRIAQLFGVPEYKITRLKQSAIKRVADSFRQIAQRVTDMTAEGVRHCLDLLLEKFPAG